MTGEEPNIIPTGLIARFLAGEANTDEIIDLEDWKARSPGNRKIFEQYVQIWQTADKSGAYSNIDLDYEWHLFNGKLNMRVDRIRDKRILLYRKLRVAAAIAALISVSTLSFFLIMNSGKTTITAVNQNRTYTLPDSSIVYLYPGSEIAFTRSFGEEGRQVRLEGEAFFEVKPNASKPFMVISDKAMVRVLGTSFSLAAWPGQKAVTLVVESGKVAFIPAQEPDAQQITMPGEKLVYSISEKQSFKTQNTDLNYHSWKTGIISFDNAAMSEVVAVLSRTFNIPVEFRPQPDDHCSVSVVFDKKDLGYILRTLSETLNLQVERKPEKIILISKGC